MILEYCAEGDLSKYLFSNTSILSEAQAVEILIQLMDGFKELVTHGYIHREIKPANILIRDKIY